MDLTKRQQEIFDFIKRYSAKYGYPPTVRDIGKAVGLASSSTVHAHLSNLERIGMLRRDPSKPRAIELLDRAAAGVRTLVKPGLPLVGQVAAGQPVLAEENIEDYVQTPSYAGGEDGAYLLRIRGESMQNVGILDGDLVVVKPQDVADDGDIVVALLGDEATVKRFFQEADHIRLQPENDSMEPIRSRDARVMGKVVGLMQEHVVVSTLAMAPTLLESVGGEPTLDELLSGVWEGLAAHRAVECPVCRGEMEPVYGAQESPPDGSDAAAVAEGGRQADREPQGGRCAVCGTTVR